MSDNLALLRTDLVDSTRLAEELGDGPMSALMERHDTQARALLRSWRGREIDKSDGFFLVFDRVDDAVGYALAYHQALGRMDARLRARAGVHLGTVIVRDNPAADVALGAKPVEVQGLAVSIASRVMGMAMGGQTLLTAEARGALAAPGMRVVAHGHWRMKGIEEPLVVFEAGDASAPLAPPPDSSKAYRVTRRHDTWLPVAELRHSLPAERDRFVGRGLALRELADRIHAGSRLVSILGPGGTGKTRFVQRFAWNWLGDFAGGAWFCDLSQARSLDGIFHAVAQGLGVTLGRADPLEQLGNALAGRGPCLVILDNFEQVARHAEETVGRWLERAHEAQFLVTTRELLGIAGEHAFNLSPLAPQEAATLFGLRATAARRDFNPSEQDRRAIADVVKLLDGLPLAIELAAARVRVMPPVMLLERMHQRFDILTTGGRRASRQATLRAAFDWSWDLLSAAEKAALAQMSVFEGGFTIAAAERVLDLLPFAPAPSVLDLVQSLVDKSLVRLAGPRRFDLLATVREYASDRLRSVGSFPGSGTPALADARTRHARFFAGLDEVAAVAERCIELENLMAATRHAAAAGDAASATGALTAAWAALKLCGPLRAGLELAHTVAQTPSLADAQRAVVEWIHGMALHVLGLAGEARVHLNHALALSRALEDRLGQSRSLCWLSEQLAAEGRVEEAQAQLQEALALARAVGDRVQEWNALNRLGTLFQYSSRMRESLEHYELALDLARRLGDRRLEGGLLGNLGGVRRSLGDADTACRHYEDSLRIAEEVGDRQWEGNARCNLGLLLHETGRSQDARAHFERAIAIAQEMGHPRLEATVLCNLGIVSEAIGDLAAARTQYDRAVAIAGELGDRRAEGQFRGYQGLLYARCGDVAAARASLATGEAMLTEVSDDLSLALLLCGRAEAEWRAGDRAAGLETLRRAEALGAQSGANEDSEFGQARRNVRALLESGSA